MVAVSGHMVFLELLLVNRKSHTTMQDKIGKCILAGNNLFKISRKKEKNNNTLSSLLTLNTSKF